MALNTSAALSYGPESLFTSAEVELADLRDTDVLVRVEAAGICHTDLTMKSQSAQGVPALFGHEGAGIVEAVGAGVTGVDIGNKVVMSFNSCGTCSQCSAGYRPYCRDFGMLNAAGTRADGSSSVSVDGVGVWSSFFGQSSFARHAIASVQNVVVVADDVDLTIAAPMGCGFQTGAGAVVNVLRPSADSSVVVFGTGGVGMAAVMAARAVGVRTVVAVDLSEHRRAVALEVGATHALPGASNSLVEEIQEITGGGATHALDTTAQQSVISSALTALSPLGTLVTVGVGVPQLELDVLDLMSNGKTVRGCIEGDSVPGELIPKLIAWQAGGQFPVEKIITTYPFDEINEAVAAMSGEVIKPVLLFA